MNFALLNCAEDNILGKYPSEFIKSILSYGEEFAKEVVESRKFHLFDPMVSDRSCQLRAAWLAGFYSEKNDLKDLTESDILIFGLARFLYESAFFVNHEIIGNVPLKSNISFWPENLFCLDSVRKRRRFFGEAKSILEWRVVRDIYTWMKDIPSDSLVVGKIFKVRKGVLKDEILNLLKTPEMFSYSEIPIPLIYFFPGFISVITLAAWLNVVISIVFRKVIYAGTSLWRCMNTDILNFLYNPEVQNFTEIANSTQQSFDGPTVVLSSHSYVDDGTFEFNGTGFVQALNSFFKVDLSIEDYIYAMMATHAMLSGSEAVSSDIEINGAPELTQLLRKYLLLARRIDLSVHDTIPSIAKSFIDSSHIPVITKTPFEVTHIKNCSIEDMENV